jgi:phenylpropionate dioxygenase-like ring-hydroxylating dioxygenase large terminal subunit
VNWKVALENYLECYHCPVAHPGFSKMIDVDPDSYRLVVGERTSSQLGPVREGALDGTRKVAYDPRGDVSQSQYHFIWPNTTINIAPGPQNISIERWVPVDERTTVEVTDYFFGADVDDAKIDEVIAFDTQVAEEDVALVQAVQKGLDSRTVLQGRLMTESERLIVSFQRNVHDAIA